MDVERAESESRAGNRESGLAPREYSVKAIDFRKLKK